MSNQTTPPAERPEEAKEPEGPEPEPVTAASGGGLTAVDPHEPRSWLEKLKRKLGGRKV
jgi:hypothetical protein